MGRAVVFADTSYYLAALRADDPAHSRAISETRQNHLVVTTEFIIFELGNSLSRASDLSDFLRLVATLRSSTRVKIIRLGSQLLEEGLQRMEQRPDKDWSLTDCISFLVMEDAGITDALTTDRHFEQAGFRALLR